MRRPRWEWACSGFDEHFWFNWNGIGTNMSILLLNYSRHGPEFCTFSEPLFRRFGLKGAKTFGNFGSALINNFVRICKRNVILSILVKCNRDITRKLKNTYWFFITQRTVVVDISSTFYKKSQYTSLDVLISGLR